MRLFSFILFLVHATYMVGMSPFVERCNQLIAQAKQGIDCEIVELLDDAFDDLYAKERMTLQDLDVFVSSEGMLELYMLPWQGQNIELKIACCALVYYWLLECMQHNLLVIFDENYTAQRYFKQQLFALTSSSWMKKKYTQWCGACTDQTLIKKQLHMLGKQEEQLSYTLGTLRHCGANVVSSKNSQELCSELLLQMGILCMVLKSEPMAIDDPAQMVIYLKGLIGDARTYCAQQQTLVQAQAMPGHFARHKVAYALSGATLLTVTAACVYYAPEIQAKYQQGKQMARFMYQEHIKKPISNVWHALTHKPEFTLKRFEFDPEKVAAKALEFLYERAHSRQLEMQHRIDDRGLAGVGLPIDDTPANKAMFKQKLTEVYPPFDTPEMTARVELLYDAIKKSCNLTNLHEMVQAKLIGKMQTEMLKMEISILTLVKQMQPELTSTMQVVKHNSNTLFSYVEQFVQKNHLTLELVQLIPATLVGTGLVQSARYAYYSLFRNHFTYQPIKQLLRELEDLLIASLGKMLDPQVEGKIYFLTEKILLYQYELAEDDQMLLAEDMKKLQSTDLSFQQKLYVMQRMQTSYIFLV